MREVNGRPGTDADAEQYPIEPRNVVMPVGVPKPIVLASLWVWAGRNDY